MLLTSLTLAGSTSITTSALGAPSNVRIVRFFPFMVWFKASLRARLISSNSNVSAALSEWAVTNHSVCPYGFWTLTPARPLKHESSAWLKKVYLFQDEYADPPGTAA